MSPEVEQLLNSWDCAGTVLSIEFASEHIAVFGRGIVVRSFRRDQLLLDCRDDCKYEISLRDATCELRPVNPADPLG